MSRNLDIETGKSKQILFTVYAVKYFKDYNTKLDQAGPGCSKLSTSLVNVSLNFQKFISQICQHFLLKKCVKLLHCKSFFFFKQKSSVYLVIKW